MVEELDYIFHATPINVKSPANYSLCEIYAKIVTIDQKSEGDNNNTLFISICNTGLTY